MSKYLEFTFQVNNKVVQHDIGANHLVLEFIRRRWKRGFSNDFAVRSGAECVLTVGQEGQLRQGGIVMAVLICLMSVSRAGHGHCITHMWICFGKDAFFMGHLF